MRTTIHDRNIMRREPRQGRSRETVQAVLAAVPRVIRRDGIDALTTNRIAEAAGVSIGSLYQFFPNKQSIFSALHGRHVEDVHGVVAQALAQATVEGVPALDVFTGRLVAGLAELHAAEPELHELISEQVPEGPAGFRRGLREIFAQLTSSKRMLFVLPHVIEALVHGIAEQRRSLPAATLKDEAVETALTCLASCQKA